MKPTQALQGKDLTLAIDDYLTRGVQTGPRIDHEAQEAELLYIIHAADKKLTRLSPSERRAINDMVKFVREQIANTQALNPDF